MCLYVQKQIGERVQLMNNMVEIEVVIDENFAEPKVTIQTKEKTKQVENIVYAIENVTENDFPIIPATGDEGIEFISQRDIVRVFTEGRKVQLQTEDGIYTIRKTLTGIEKLTAIWFITSGISLA